MKKVSLLILVLGLLFSCKEAVKKENTEAVTLSNRIEVIDFHSTHRCMTCNAIESHTKYALDLYFPEELKNEKITFQTVNVDEEKNVEIAEKFQATGTSLFLNVIVDGTETQVDLTDFAFMEASDESAFVNKLKTKLETELAKI